MRLYVATQPVNGRKGPDSLMALVRDVLRHDPLSGHLFISCSKRCDRVRIVYWGRNGFALLRTQTSLVLPELRDDEPDHVLKVGRRPPGAASSSPLRR